MLSFNELIQRLHQFWSDRGCVIHQGWDLECGAGTFNPATFLRALGPEPYASAYVEPSTRPTDGRYGENPNRVQQHYQYQVMLKPSPPDIQTVYLESLKAVGLPLSEHDIRFVHDDWEQPSLGAWGLGWEAWVDGMEVTQITYFQQAGGLEVKPVVGELTYGLERLAMYIQKVDSIYDIQWTDNLTYGDICQRSEWEWSTYNFEEASTDMWLQQFDDYIAEAEKMLEKKLPLPAYHLVAKASHAFNILDARGAISVTERARSIRKIRTFACQASKAYVASRKELGFPLLKKANPKPTPPLPSLPTPSKQDSFLLEIGSEEIPATYVEKGLADLTSKVKKLLEEQNLAYTSITPLGTPRRLALLIEDLALSKPAQTEERKGPPVDRCFDTEGRPTSAGAGFFRSIGVEPLSLSKIKKGTDTLFIKAIKQTPYLFARLSSPAESTLKILSENLPSIILNLSFPKKMRWADYDITYARPILWVTALYGNHFVPLQVGPLQSGTTTYGHRQLDPAPITLTHPSQYVDTLRNHSVIVSIDERKKSILDQLATLETKEKIQIIEKERVVPEVLHLVEYPQITLASFEKSFLKAPPELLISEMVEHQRYFPVADAKGKLLNQFVITANNTPSEQIRHGNCKVLSARLADGVFLYEHDLKLPLDHFWKKLEHTTFQKELGTLADKSNRLEKYVATLHSLLSIGNLDDALRAAHLCKVDLASGTVYEFPDLQGKIGAYYARHHGEKKSVAQAVEEHWMPTGDKAPLPASNEGTLVSLADKVDNLIGCFSTGLRPTSSSDPYALRRQVLGIIRILTNGKHHLSLSKLFHQCCSLKETVDDILLFFVNRIKTVFLDYGFSKDEIAAALSYQVDDVYDALCRVEALHTFRSESDLFDPLLEVYKRAKGQINSFGKLSFSEEKLFEPAEKNLSKLLFQTEKDFSSHLKNHNYTKAYIEMARLQPTLAELFDNVKILDDDPQVRDNRIALLQKVFGRFEQLVDFSQL